jgi:ribosomal-protein-alanine N-acetyltransferase
MANHFNYIWLMSVIIQSPRIVFREFLAAERPVYLNHFNNEFVTLYLPKRSIAERINIFNNALNQYLITKRTGIWGLFSQTNGDFIGSCLLRPFNEEPGTVELGYSLEQKYWRQGLGTEMAFAMITHAFSHADVSEIVAVTVLENVGSRRVLEKAGFSRVANLLRDGEELAFFKLKRPIAVKNKL